MISIAVVLVTLTRAADRPTPLVFPEIVLSDGRAFPHAELRTFSASGVLIKYDGGLVQAAYSLLPENVRAAAASQIAAATANSSAKRQPIESLDPAADTRAKAPGEVLINGRCFVSAGDQQHGLAQVKILVYPANEFSKVVDEIEQRVNPRWMEIDEIKKQAESHHDLAAVTQAVNDQQALAFSKWDQLPAPTAVAKTDNEGRFSLTHRLKGEFLIFARTALKSDSQTRHYVWLLSSKTIADPRRVFLTNDNTL